MQVLFTKEVKGVAHKGEVKNVAAGFFRNYLVPGRLAVLAGEKQIAQAEAARQKALERREKQSSQAKDLKEKLEALVYETAAKVSGKKRLYGSITENDVLKLVAEKSGLRLDASAVEMKEHLKTLGEHSVVIKLSEEVSAKITVKVVAAE